MIKLIQLFLLYDLDSIFNDVNNCQKATKEYALQSLV